MNRALVGGHSLELPEKLACFFDDPPLIKHENREDYESFFWAIALDVRPEGAIAWLYAKDVVDLSWEIRRERKIKAEIINLGRNSAISAKISTRAWPDLPPIKNVIWKRGDPESRSAIEKKLADNNYDQGELMAAAFIKQAAALDAIDERIRAYELRRMAVLRELEIRNEAMARKLERVAATVLDAAVLDGEVTLTSDTERPPI